MGVIRCQVKDYLGGGPSPIFPHPTFVPVTTREDVRAAISDETAVIEREFGRGFANTYEDLVWLLNACAPGLMTTHTFCRITTLGDPDRWGADEFLWATYEVRSQNVILPRDPRLREDPEEAGNIARELAGVLLAHEPKVDQGLAVWVCADHIRFAHAGGFRPGCAAYLGIAGYANSLAQAGRRWARLVELVARALATLPPLENEQ